MTTDRIPIVITAVGPDNVRLADPIVHYVTGQGASIAEIQMYDHDEEAIFAMLIRIQLPCTQLNEIRQALAEIGKLKSSAFASGRPKSGRRSRDWRFASPTGRKRRWPF